MSEILRIGVLGRWNEKFTEFYANYTYKQKGETAFYE